MATRKRKRNQASGRSTAAALPAGLVDVAAVRHEIIRRLGTDAELLRSAADKRAAGERPSRHEQAAIRRRDRVEEDVWREFIYGRIPQKHVRDLAGRQTKQLHEFADRWGAPVGGPALDLGALLRWLFGFPKKCQDAAEAAASDDPLLMGQTTPALERYREEKWRLARLERERIEGTLVPLAHVQDLLNMQAMRIRQAGEQLERQKGPDAADILREALDDLDQEAEQFFAAQ